MDKIKQELIKKYYLRLISLMILYVVVILLLKGFGFYDPFEHLLISSLMTVLYYLIVRNGLMYYTKRKLYDLDSELKEKAQAKAKRKAEERRVLFPKLKGKWYRNIYIIYTILIVAIVLLFILYR